jgi:hypothetical protein
VSDEIQRSMTVVVPSPTVQVGKPSSHPVAEDGACAGPIDVAPARERLCRHRYLRHLLEAYLSPVRPVEPARWTQRALGSLACVDTPRVHTVGSRLGGCRQRLPGD